MSTTTGSQQPKLLDEVRHVLRLQHYSIHTERSYVEWVVRFVRFHGMRSRADLLPAEPKIEAFLTDLAVRANVAASTQRWAGMTNGNPSVTCTASRLEFASLITSLHPIGNIFSGNHLRLRVSGTLSRSGIFAIAGNGREVAR